MSQEAGLGGRRSITPVSGRSTPVHRIHRQNLEDGGYPPRYSKERNMADIYIAGVDPKDKSYRRYAAGVERALSSFETPQQEWADYISFLGRLLKALQARPPEIRVVPESATIALRLSQCLSPSLPSGVHQKALELYGCIFSVLKSETLSQELYVYLPGLSSVLSFASLSVRPYFLAIFDNYVVPLEFATIRPALKAIILSLLPGLEDETSEDFDRILETLDKFRSKSEPADHHPDWETQCSFFWQCFFLATVASASRRQGALAYLTRKLPKFGTKGSQDIAQLSAEAQAALSPEPGLLVRCLAVGLTDKQALVQRGFLDLLVTHLPLHSTVLQKSVPVSDLRRLVAAAAGVVQRRDMSLNRRLWTWFLGPDLKADSDADVKSPDAESKSPVYDKAAHHAEYFARYGLQALSYSILGIINNKGANTVAERSRPFRICLSLMDRWEVGGLLIPDVFVPAIDSAYTFNKTASRQEASELIRSASIFFDGIESGLIWAKFFHLARDALSTSPLLERDRDYKLELCDFIVRHFNLREEEMLLIHIPLTILGMLLMIQTAGAAKGTSKTLGLAFDVIEKLSNLIPDRAFLDQSNDADLSNGTAPRINDSSSALQQIESFYGENQGSLEGKGMPIGPARLGSMIFTAASEIFKTRADSHSAVDMERCTKIIVTLIGKIDKISTLPQAAELVEFLMNSIDERNGLSEQDFALSSAATAILVAFRSKASGNKLLSIYPASKFQQVLTTRFWPYLSPLQPKFHVEAVRCLASLDSLSENRGVEASIASLIQSSSTGREEKLAPSPNEAGQRFAILWTHLTQDSDKTQKAQLRRGSGPYGLIATMQAMADPTIILTRPLLLLLECLSDDGSDLSVFTRAWLQELPTLGKVFQLLIERITSLHSFSKRDVNTGGLNMRASIRTKHCDDTVELVYYLKLTLNILRFASQQTWLVLGRDSAPPILPQREELPEPSLQILLSQICLASFNIQSTRTADAEADKGKLHHVCLDVLRLLMSSPFAGWLEVKVLELDLLQRLRQSIDSMDPTLQASLLETATTALKLKQSQTAPPPLQSPTGFWRGSRQASGSNARTSISREDPSSENATTMLEGPPTFLIECLKAGFSSPSIHPIIENWVTFLVDVLPLFSEYIFQHMIPLVECFCSQINDVLGQLKSIFSGQPAETNASPETTLVGLMNGIEHILSKSHDQLVIEEAKIVANPKSPDQQQSFFGAVVQGVFTGEGQQQQIRSSIANSRLTVLLCFQDTVRTCFSVWRWGLYGPEADQPPASCSATFSYASLRMRNRARRLLEQMFAAEALECLETLVVLWSRPSTADFQCESIIGLLNVLSSSRPKRTVPCIFNAIYSRTNPSALDPSRMSSLTSDLSDIELIAFLVDYTSSIDDDAMDEIWNDCMTFLRDILSNPMPQRQILPMLLEFTALLAEKVDNTNFGDQRRMRRELGVSSIVRTLVIGEESNDVQDVFLRLLTATFTTRPQGFIQEAVKAPASSHSSAVTIARAGDIMSILASIIPKIQLVLADNERIANAASSISTNIIAPVFKAKTFPTNIDNRFLDVLLQLARVSPAGKFWRKDVSDALNDPRFFNTPLELVQGRWMTIFKQLCTNDKERMPELISRLSAPTTAGVVFGVGATSARMEADRKTQANLRRIALLVLSCPVDTFMTDVGKLHEKLAELFTTKPVSAPSSAILPEVFTAIRAVVLKTSGLHLAPMWPTINLELQRAIFSVLSDDDADEKYSNTAILHACKLLDLLVTLEPDDFQLQEWLFITDTIDAVYKPASWRPAALADDIAEALAAADSENAPITPHAHQFSATGNISNGRRRPFLDTILEGLSNDVDASDLRSLPKSELASRVLRPFLGQLSMVAFEETYGLLEPDIETCLQGVLVDLFDGSVGGEV